MGSEDDGWTWKFAPRAAKQFENLEHHVQDRIVSKLDEIVDDPWRDPGDYLEPLTGGPFEKLRVGQYRLACVLDLMKDDPVEAETTFFKNSLWLIHHECITKHGLKKDFRRTIQATPPRTQVCIWIDAPESDHDSIENELDKITDSQNVPLSNRRVS